MDQQDKSGAGFTKGPWAAINATAANGHPVFLIYAVDDGHIGKLGASVGTAFKRSDASLILAAPELYEALKSCVAALNPYSDEAKEAYAALAKATGSQQ